MFDVGISFHFSTSISPCRICVTGDIKLPFMPFVGLFMTLADEQPGCNIDEFSWSICESKFEVFGRNELDNWSDDLMRKLIEPFRAAGYTVEEFDDSWIRRA